MGHKNIDNDIVLSHLWERQGKTWCFRARLWPFWVLGGGPDGSQSGDIVCLDTGEIGWQDREIAYEILVWADPILLTYESDKGKRGVFGLVSGRFGGDFSVSWPHTIIRATFTSSSPNRNSIHKPLSWVNEFVNHLNLKLS